VSQGRLEGQDLAFSSISVGRTSTGSAVRGLERRYHVWSDRLTYELDMSMDEVSLTRHLAAELHRSPA
jgi:THAP4-like, heme-binding beta-barrel domain